MKKLFMLIRLILISVLTSLSPNIFSDVSLTLKTIKQSELDVIQLVLSFLWKRDKSLSGQACNKTFVL